MRKRAQHGTHSKYVLGCRCDICFKAEQAYHREYRRKNPQLRKISADKVREHIILLASYGVGQNAVADACGVGPATVKKIRQGKQQKIYARTAQRILSVTPEAIADSALVDAANGKRILRELLEEGYSRPFIARQLGVEQLHYLYNRKLRARTELKIEKLYRRNLTIGLRSNDDMERAS